MITLFSISFFYVFLRALQQRNVAFDNFLWVIPISWLMSGMDAFMIMQVAKADYTPALVFALGTGSGLGAMLAMYLHRRWIKK